MNVDFCKFRGTATVMSYAENGQWWLKLDDGFGVRVGAAELFWKEWMFLNLKKSH